MDRAELVWRLRAAARTGLDRARAGILPPRWDRRILARRLAPLSELTPVRTAIEAERWDDAHAAIGRYLVESPQRFVIGPSSREVLARRILQEFPGSGREAVARAERVLAGQYDLLGYERLCFASATSEIDWHLDPVYQRRAPVAFWTTVPFLDPACGDHKIIWELNRHQHWLTLGRAFWLTGEIRFRERALGELASWLDANPPLTGINWTSMLELGFRTLSWLWTLNFFIDPAETGERPWSIDLLVGLDRQLEHIERNLSHYFSPNTHLLGEALALYVTSRALPIFKRSARREALGRRILCDEIARQIAADGGHCERSTYYHRYTLDFYLLALAVARVTGDAAAARFHEAVARLASAARLLADDRGRLPHIGDDDGGEAMPLTGRPADDVCGSLATASAILARPDLGIGPPTEETLWLLAHPTFESALDGARHSPSHRSPSSDALPDTGYYVSRSAAGDHLVMDGGPHGYQNGGHAHADALSLALSVRRVPLLIDPGTGSYTADRALRDRLRSTVMHNTLTLDERSQSTPIGPFHWSSTASATIRRWQTNAAFDYFEAAHDGYRPLEHRRHVLALPGDVIVVADLVADLVAGEGIHRADMHWHVDPRWRIDVSGRRAVFTTATDRAQLVVPRGFIEAFAGDETTGLGWHSPVYGRVEPSTTLRVRMDFHAPSWIVAVFGLNPAGELLDVETVPVWAEAGVLEHSIALWISRAGSTDHVLIAHSTGAAGSTWRVGEVETDARVLFWRHEANGLLTRVAMVDGSVVRAGGRLRLALPRRAPDLYLDELRIAAETVGNERRQAARGVSPA
jgi:uncharacterized heparinase superfamily protein